MVDFKYVLKILEAIFFLSITVFGLILAFKLLFLVLFQWHPNMDKINYELQKAHNQQYCYLTEEVTMGHHGIAKRAYYRRCE